MELIRVALKTASAQPQAFQSLIMLEDGHLRANYFAFHDKQEVIVLRIAICGHPVSHVMQNLIKNGKIEMQ